MRKAENYISISGLLTKDKFATSGQNFGREDIVKEVLLCPTNLTALE